MIGGRGREFLFERCEDLEFFTSYDAVLVRWN